MMTNVLSPRTERAAGVSLWAAAAVTLAILLLGGAIVLEGPAVTGKLLDRMDAGAVVPHPGGVGQAVRLPAGRIPVVQFRLLSDYTGLPVIHDSADVRISTEKITVAADIPEADEDLIKSILEVNRFRVWHSPPCPPEGATGEILPNGKELVKVESMVDGGGNRRSYVPDRPSEHLREVNQ